jgi:hypothetical protein
MFLQLSFEPTFKKTEKIHILCLGSKLKKNGSTEVLFCFELPFAKI